MQPKKVDLAEKTKIQGGILDWGKEKGKKGGRREREGERRRRKNREREGQGTQVIKRWVGKSETDERKIQKRQGDKRQRQRAGTGVAREKKKRSDGESW